MERRRSGLLNIVCLIVIGLMVCSFIPLSYLLREEGQSRDNAVGFYAEENDSLDVVYIGASSCLTFWEPLRAWNNYGFTSYDFAHHTMAATTIKYYIIEALKTQQPELFIVDLRPFQYADEYNERTNTDNMHAEYAIRNGTDNLFYFNRNRINLIQASLPSGERLSYYVDLIKYHRRWIFIPYHLAQGVKTGDFSYFDLADNVKRNPYKGFYPVGRYTELSFTDYKEVVTKKTLSEEVNTVFIDLLDYCQEGNIQVLFVVHHYIQSKEDKEKFNYMKELIESYGFDFLNVNDEWEKVGFDFAVDMYDSLHTNVFGADKYTDYLADYLVTHYDLPDKRGDAAYASWDSAYETFERETEAVKEEILKALRERDGD